MATKEELLAYATSKIGTTEYEPGTNCQEFSEKLGKPCGPWAEDFILSCLESVGVSASSMSGFPEVSDLSELEAGDVVLFNHELPFDSHDYAHSGIFMRYMANGNIETIEGNTSSGNSTSQDNGDGVYRRERALLDINKAVRPLYEESPNPAV